MQPAFHTRNFYVRPGFNPFAASAYLFDIDGTLLNTRDGVHWNAFRTALLQVFAIDSLLDTISVHGNTDIGILRAVTERHGISPEIFEQRLPSALSVMRAAIESNSADMQCELCPGVRELLTELRRRAKILGVVSGNLEMIGWRKITAAGLREFFAFGSFSDQAEHRVDVFRAGLHVAQKLALQSPNEPTTQSPNPRLSRPYDCVFVGDTPADIAAAQTLGVPVIAVATGIYGFADLLASSPDACVPCCTDLLGEELGRSQQD